MRVCGVWLGLTLAGCGTFEDVGEVTFAGDEQEPEPGEPDSPVECGDRPADRCALSLSQGSGSGAHTCARMADGSLRCWGGNRDGQLGDGTRLYFSPEPLEVVDTGLGLLAQVATGSNFTCVLDTEGQVACVGGNEVGQLGNSASGRAFEVDFQTISGLPRATQIDAGGGFACALTAVEGAPQGVWCWGLNDKGQLGPEGGADGGLREVPMPEGVEPQEIVVGGDHACVLTTAQTVWCWGGNRNLALGRETGINTMGCVAPADRCLDGFECDPCPGFVNDLHDVTELVSGSRHSCAIDAGVVVCWGDNSSGQLGVAGPEPRRVFVEVDRFRAEGIAIQLLAAGDGHTCGRSDGQVYCWGANGNGQLGGECQIPIVTEPILIPGSSNTGTLALGASFSCGTYDPGGQGFNQLWCWGENALGQLGDGGVEGNCTPVDGFPVGFGAAGPGRTPLTDVLQYDVGAGHACALLDDRRLMCWGDNEAGQLGQAIPLFRDLPVEVVDLDDASDAAVGIAHTCALNPSGELFCWGNNALGRLGLPGTVVTNRPLRAVEGILGERVASGDEHTCMATLTGDVHCWGSNFSGALGDPRVDFLEVPELDPVVAGVRGLFSGPRHVCATLDDATLRCWGDNEFGQIGVEGADVCPNGQPCVTAPVVVEGVQEVRGVALGAFHTCAIVGEGRVMCWGANFSGQLGLGFQSDSIVPPSEIPELSGVVGISAGASHTCAFDAEGRVYCWGGNNDAQLGYGEDDPQCDGCQSSPRRLVRPVDVVQIVSGGGHTCALQRSGEVQCWGNNVFGQLGAGFSDFTEDILTVAF